MKSEVVSRRRSALLASAALAALTVLLLLTTASSGRAADATWLANPTNGNWVPAGASVNWSTGGTTFPGSTSGTTNTDAATFDFTNQHAVTVNTTVNVGGIAFTGSDDSNGDLVRTFHLD